MGLCLGFHFHVPAITRIDGIYMPGYQGRFVDSLACYCEKVVCFLHSPVGSEVSHMDYRVLSPNVSLVDIGPHESVLKRTLKTGKIKRQFASYSHQLDAILLRGPSPLLPAIANGSPLPTVLLLVGDYTTGINDLPQPAWRKEIIRLWSYWNKWQQNGIAARSLTFVNSKVLYKDLKSRVPHLHEIRTTTLTKDDFFLRSDTCRNQPYRLLFVGRMDRAKGLLNLAEAVSILISRGKNVSLDLVGWETPNDPILDEVQALSKAKGIAGKILYLGPASLGNELFSHYINADVFVTASLASEGFPRTIWEAMAHSLPVVATRVGSIPALIEGAAQLAEPNDSLGLADAIQSVLDTPQLRAEYIKRGMGLVSENTSEVQVKSMVEKIENWIGSKQ